MWGLAAAILFGAAALCDEDGEQNDAGDSTHSGGGGPAPLPEEPAAGNVGPDDNGVDDAAEVEDVEDVEDAPDGTAEPDEPAEAGAEPAGSGGTA